MQTRPTPDPLAADSAFFSAILAPDPAALSILLSEDFLLIDVLSGSEIDKPTLLSALSPAGPLRFTTLTLVHRRARTHGPCSLITGETHLAGQYASTPFSAHSRYTHVFTLSSTPTGPQWLLTSAQGTPISSAAAAAEPK
jgi:hypothetical protein